MFFSAFLLFSVQPMFSKMVLPLLGGAPAVWNTCMVFFQLTLLAGYAYAHFLASRPLKIQAAVHTVLLAVMLMSLPVSIPFTATASTYNYPIPWLLKVLFFGVGIPFFTISSTAPLLQKWFSRTSHPSSQDPYFLYAASNTGSLFALLSYPLLIEPALPAAVQNRLWSASCAVFAAWIIGCLFWTAKKSASRGTQPLPETAPPSSGSPRTAPGQITWKRRIRWILLAFVPSSLMLGITTFISTDIASVPLIWLVPLFLYLLTFVLAFSDGARNVLLPAANRAVPIFAVPLAILILMKPFNPLILIIGFHLFFFFAASLVCHGELARDRPPVRYLTNYYFWISAGGVLGGAFNALLAPWIFKTVLEYPLAIILACFLRPPVSSGGAEPEFKRTDIVYPLLMALLIPLLYQISKPWANFDAVQKVSLLTMASRMLVYALPGLICFSFRNRPVRFSIGLALFILAHSCLYNSLFAVKKETRYSKRTFFGTSRVQDNGKKNLRDYYHGTTLHGAQSLDPARQGEPLTYFHPTGPVGKIFDVFRTRTDGPRIAVVGLGAGSLAAYSRQGESWDFYEIDPAVKHIASNPAYFTYLARSPSQVTITLGDGRLSIARMPPNIYGLIFLDAFSSDSIPMHLISKEAVLLYLSKLKENGLLVFNVSNRYLNLAPVLSSIAKTVGLVCYLSHDFEVSRELVEQGKTASVWVVMARHPQDLGTIPSDPKWKRLEIYRKNLEWSDDYSNLLGVLIYR